MLSKEQKKVSDDYVPPIFQDDDNADKKTFVEIESLLMFLGVRIFAIVFFLIPWIWGMVEMIKWIFS
ncbi:hypothetical protein KAR91_65115 [Candidatus Pacearchaeota archaeon]|nr:hypothetical protein [Candidatus Pacearchaeota archaeon]